MKYSTQNTKNWLWENDRRLSPSFTIGEFLSSLYAAGHDLDNIPSHQSVLNMEYLCEAVLQPIRDHYGRAVKITSGYRSPAVNAGVSRRSTAKSHHLAYGNYAAADIQISGVAPEDIFNLIDRLRLPFVQCILEYDRWVHVSTIRPRRQRLIVTKKGTVEV